MDTAVAPAPPTATRRTTARPVSARDIRLNLGWYRRGRGDPTTRLGETWMARAMLTPQGPATALVDWSSGLRTAAWGPGASWAEAAMARIAAPDDPLPIPTGAAPLVRDAARRNPYLRAQPSGDLYHALLPAIVEQRITTGEAVRQWARLVSRLGEVAPGPFPGLLLPPAPAVLARTPTWWFHPLGIEVKRARALIAVARVAHRLWDVAEQGETAAVAASLGTLPGVGPWTVGTVLGPACGDDDAVPIGDCHFPNIVAWNLAGEARGHDARMLELLEPYRPHRGWALRLVCLAGRPAPAFGPKRRILPMHRF